MPEKIRFTATSLAALQPRAQRYIAWDHKHSGLGMRVSPQGTKTAVFLYRFNGKARFLTLGNFPARTVEQILEDYYPGTNPFDHAAIWIEEVYTATDGSSPSLPRPVTDELTTDHAPVSATTLASCTFTLAASQLVLIEGTCSMGTASSTAINANLHVNGTARRRVEVWLRLRRRHDDE